MRLYEAKPYSDFNLERRSFFTLLTSWRNGTFSSGLDARCLLGLRGVFMALLEMLQKFSTDEKCREILTKLRWPEGVTCPRCKERNVCYLESRKQFECGSCGHQFSVTTGTIFNDTHLPLEKWFAATYLLCEAKKGMSACQIQQTLGISYKTAWYLCHRIRAAMLEAERPMLSGIVEMDETYVGGKQRGKGHRGPRADKEIVIGIRQRGGPVRFFHASDVRSGTLAQFIRENVSADADVIITDELPAYVGATRQADMGERHRHVNHRSRVYVEGEIHTNTVENAFSLLKRGIMGTWHRISAKHLASYLQEMEFRFNRRQNSESLYRYAAPHGDGSYTHVSRG